ncbi:YjiH family protein [Balneatrix alpica]|uniref:YjiH family protein n=1 Tax=Balneatrix alpica TaxID=75684 RepID=A0ABV5ZF81_9GAMM|nr:YjiH family protein [Balneatrix alpica]
MTSPSSAIPEERRVPAIVKLIAFSLIGILFFFVPVTLNGVSTIPLDHLVSWLRQQSGIGLYALALIIAGGLYPFIQGSWRRNMTSRIFSLLKLAGVVVGLMAYFEVGPDFLFSKDMLPFLFNKLVIPVGLIVPIGAVFLAFLISYGLLELVGVLVQPIMRPLWKTPGRSAIDAVASFVGSYSIGLLITNRVYKAGGYSAKEAAIIATGFSTVSATFMVIVAKTLGLMEIWNLYFWSTLLVSFSVTAIHVRLWPLAGMDNHSSQPEPQVASGQRLQQAMSEGLQVAEKAPPLWQSVALNLKEGVVMAIAILPSILSIGLLGLLVAKYTPVFDWLGYLFYPFAWLAQLPDPLAIGKASATGLAEMFLPALLMAQADVVSRFVIGVVSVSSILFFSATIPCVLSTEIPLSVRQMVVIWFQRTALSILLASPLAYYAASQLASSAG